MNEPLIPDANPEPRQTCALRPPWGVWSGPRFTEADRLRADPFWTKATAHAMAIGDPLPTARTHDRSTLSALEQVYLLLDAQARFGPTLAQLADRIGIPRHNLNNWRYRRVRMPQSAVDALLALLEHHDAPE